MNKPVVSFLAFSTLALLVGTTAFAKAKDKYPALPCGKTALDMSSCMIRAMLDDVKRTSTMVYGGGITEIKALATYSYQIRLRRDEADDLITYEFEVLKNGKLRILKKSESTDSAK